MTTINISVPLDPEQLKNTAAILHTLALSMEKPTVVIEPDKIAGDADIDTSGSAIENKIAPADGGTMVVATGVELDKAGLPWDARIHGLAKSQTKKDGLWKKIKNIEANKPGLVEQVEAELRSAMAAPAATVETATAETTTTAKAPPPPAAASAAPPPPPPAAATETIYITPNGDEFTADELKGAGWGDDQITALPTKVVEVAAVIADSQLSFPQLLAKINSAMLAETITDANLAAALAKVGLASLPLVATRPDLIPAIDADLFG